MDIKQLSEAIRENLDKYVIMSVVFTSKLAKMEGDTSITKEFLKKNTLKKLTSINEILSSELNILQKTCHYFGMDEEQLDTLISQVNILFSKFRGQSTTPNQSTSNPVTLDISENMPDHFVSTAIVSAPPQSNEI
jgi:hypothetical protein